MKRLIYLILFSLIILPVKSEDFFDTYTGIDNSWTQNKPVTNQEFEKAIETLQANQKKKEEKAKKKKIKKISGGGTSLHSNLEPGGEILSQDKLKTKEEGNLLNVPVCLVIDNKLLDKGFYNVYGEKDKDGNVYLKLYQSQTLAGTIKAIETNDDFGEDSIDFVNYIPEKNNQIKLIFGSLKFNAYAYVQYFEEENLNF